MLISHQTATMLAEAIEMAENMSVKNVKAKKTENYQQMKQQHLIFMNNIKKSLIFIYELTYFMLISIPLSIILYITATIISKFKNI